MKNRIAIQLFGHLRSFRKTHESFFEYIVKPQIENGYDVDIFIHTWNETDHSTITWHNQNAQTRGREVTNEIIKEVKNIYKPKEILVEAQIDAPDYIITEKIAQAPRAFKGVVNVAYTKYMSSKLRREYARKYDIKYEYVIVTRPDIIFHEPFDIENFLNVYKEYNWETPNNGLFFGHNFFARGNVEDKHMIGGSDIIFFGSETAIDKATSCYEKIKEGKINTQNISNDFYCFEIFWYKYWQSQGLEPIRLKYLQFSSYNIIRNEEEYNQAIVNNEIEQEKIKSIKINAYNGYDENIKDKAKHKNKKKRFLKLRREILKFLPYFLVHKEVTRLQNKINRCS